MPDVVSLRRDLRAARAALSEPDRSRASQKILMHLQTQPIFNQAQHIAFYYPLLTECDPLPCLRWAHLQNKQLYLPVLHPAQQILFFSRYVPGDVLQKNKLGVLEPIASVSDCIAAEDLDLVLLPLVGFDRRGGRLGMGGGYYDKTFSFCTEPSGQGTRPYLLGVAFACQEYPTLPLHPWDVMLDGVVTEQDFIHCRVTS